jgi:hypothetical protein
MAERRKLMEMKYRIILLLSVFLSVNLALRAQGFTETRTYKRTFPASEEISFNIVNKYGTIQITNGRSDSVSVIAEVIASSPNAQRMRKMLNGISVNMAETAWSIRVQSDFSSNPGFLIEDFKNITGKIIPYENRLQVNYYIIVPHGINMTIDNMYGDVYLEDVSGNLSLTLSNGSLQTGHIEKASLINLSFVNGSVTGIGEGKISVSYSDLTIGASGDLDITARSSKLEMTSCEEMSLNSRRDKLFIGSAGSINADSYFSEIFIETVSGEVILKSVYGSLRIPALRNSISLLSVNAQFTELYFGLEQGFRAGVDIKTTSTNTSFTRENTSLTEQTLNSDKKEVVIYGNIGGESPVSKIKIDAVRGSLTIRHN